MFYFFLLFSIIFKINALSFGLIVAFLLSQRTQMLINGNEIKKLREQFLRLSRKNVKNLSQAEIKNHELLLADLAAKMKSAAGMVVVEQIT